MKFNESQTKQNLAKSFAAECQAGARYQFMATQAQNEMLVYVKDTLKLIAKNEMAHAKLFYDYIVEKCGDECKVEFGADYPYVDPKLDVSLEKEAEIERDEFENLYPEFARVAREEGYDDIATSFEEVAKVEQTHSEMLKQITSGYKNNNMYSSRSKQLLKCSNCGHIECATDGWKKCPLCSLGQGYIALDFSEVLQNCVECD